MPPASSTGKAAPPAAPQAPSNVIARDEKDASFQGYVLNVVLFFGIVDVVITSRNGSTLVPERSGEPGSVNSSNGVQNASGGDLNSGSSKIVAKKLEEINSRREK